MASLADKLKNLVDSNMIKTWKYILSIELAEIKKQTVLHVDEAIGKQALSIIAKGNINS